MKPINVLSCFDGISAGQVALERAGIPVKHYFASEIDKYAISVTQFHYPKTIQLGSIEDWKYWLLPDIDLLIGGSPCQGFSNAGVGLNFEDPRSKLFFDFVNIKELLEGKNKELKHLLENVRMKKEWKDVISSYMKEEPILINSSLVSAQERKRYYWTNIPNLGQPPDLGIYLKDILEDGETDRDKSYCIDANYHKGSNLRLYYKTGRRQIVRTIAHGYIPESEKEMDKYPTLCGQSPRSKHLIKVGLADSIKGHDYNRRVYSPEGKSPSLAAHSGGNLEPKIITKSKTIRSSGRESPKGDKHSWDGYLIDGEWRILTPLECERLQTLPDNYTNTGISKTQRYKCVGNSWTVDVIVWLLQGLKEKEWQR